MNQNTSTGLDDKVNGLLLYAMVVVALVVGVGAMHDALLAVDPASLQAVQAVRLAQHVATAHLPDVE